MISDSGKKSDGRKDSERFAWISSQCFKHHQSSVWLCLILSKPTGHTHTHTKTPAEPLQWQYINHTIQIIKIRTSLCDSTFSTIGSAWPYLWFQPQTLWGGREWENKGRRSSTLLCSKPCQITFDPRLLSHTFTMCCFPTSEKISTALPAFITSTEKPVPNKTHLS